MLLDLALVQLAHSDPFCLIQIACFETSVGIFGGVVCLCARNSWLHARTGRRCHLPI